MDLMTKLFLFLGDHGDRCLTTEDSPDSNVLCSKILLAFSNLEIKIEVEYQMSPSSFLIFVRLEKV